MKLLAVLSVGLTAWAWPDRTINSLIPVRTTAAYEIHPVAGSGYLAWARLRLSNHRYDTYVARGRGRPIRVNPPGTSAVPGGIDGSTLAYAQRSRTHRSSLMLYDLRTNERRLVKLASNVRCSPNCTIFGPPSISGDWLLYSYRGALGYSSSVELRSLSRGRELTLDSGANVTAGQVSGRYAVWTACEQGSCHVRMYDIVTGSTTTLPAGRQAFAPSVTPVGTVYLTRQECGGELVRIPLGGPPEEIGQGNGGIGSTYALRLKDKTIVYVEEGRCEDGDDSDIYAYVDKAG